MIILVDPDPSVETAVTAALGAGPDIVRVNSVEQADTVVLDPATQVDAVIVGGTVAHDDALALVQRVTEAHPDASVILLAHMVTRSLLQQAMRAGAADVIDAGVLDGELDDAVRRALRRGEQLRQAEPAAPEPSDGPSGRVTTVFSTKGGCGKSLVATNLAILLAERHQESVALVDLDLQSGDLALMLQLLPAWTIHDAAVQGTRLDHDALQSLLTAHRSGVQLLAAPLDPALAEAIDAETVQHLLRLLRGQFAHVIVDSPAFFTDQVLAALDESDECVLVGSLDVPSIKNVKLAVQTLQAIGFPRNRMRVLVNRADSSVGLRLAEVEKSLETPVDIAVPSSRDVPLSVNQGVPLAHSKPRSSVVGALAKLAELVAGGPPRVARAGRRRTAFTARSPKG